MIKLKDILKEDEVTDTFGDVAFGSDRALVKLQGLTKFEPDTEYETELLGLLSSWAKQGPNHILSDNLYKNFPLLKKAAKRFPKLLLPETPNGTPVYRGLDSPSQGLIQKLKKTKPEDWKKEGPMMVYTKPIKYKPHRKVQSWTTDIRVASIFSAEGPYEARDGDTFLLRSQQNDEFLFNQNLINYLFWGDEFSESEILHFGTTFKEEIFISMTYTKWKRMFWIWKKEGNVYVYTNPIKE